jgi:DNA-binding NtrC family response regulator
MTSQTSSSRPFVFVDDEPLILESFELLFRSQMSCPVHCFLRPADALARLAELNPGVILTDYSMPGMTGLQFLAEAQKILPNTNFVIMTGEPIEFDEAELRLLPTLKGILRKPQRWKPVAEFVVRHWPDETAPAILLEPSLAS